MRFAPKSGRKANVAGLEYEYDLRRTKRSSWLPDMDLNHDKQIQSLLCYRYTIGQMEHAKRKRCIVGVKFR